LHSFKSQTTMVHTCKFCYKQFGRKDNLNRHLHNIHSEEMQQHNTNNGHGSDDDYLYSDVESNDSDSVRGSTKSTSDSITDSDIETEDEGRASNVKSNHMKYDIWKHFIDETYEAKEEDLNDLIQTYREHDPHGSLEDLSDEAFAELKPQYVNKLRQIYTDFMKNMYALQRNPYHGKIMRTAKRLREDEDFSKDEAIQYAAKKRKYLLEEIIDSYTLPEVEDAEDSSESNLEFSDDEK